MRLVLLCRFFLSKERTAYGLRISDWSSDVCSADLGLFGPRLAGRGQHVDRDDRRQQPDDDDDDHQFDQSEAVFGGTPQRREAVFGGTPTKSEAVFGGTSTKSEAVFGGTSTKSEAEFGGRSEEHTSELQSLMRIKYAVFCLNKKKNIL